MLSYKEEKSNLLDEVSSGIAESLRRLAAVHPQGIYELIHSFDPDLPRNRPGISKALNMFLKSIRIT